MAKVEIDQEACVADQVCASMAPEIFEMRDDTGKAHVIEGMEELEGDQLQSAKDAADSCPVDAIHISE